jgi:uridine phosphorylase
VGDPNRAAAAAEHLEGAEEVGNWREYRSFTGHYKGKRITISSHGVGAAGAAVCFESLIYAGVRAMIRAGTCGAMRADINDGDFVIATGAVREDGTTDQLIPLAYPAVADYRVVQALEAAAIEAGFPNPHLGLVRTSAAFFPGLLPKPFEMWMKANVISTEMELAALLVIASLRGVRAGGILVSDGNLARKMEEAKKGKVYDQFKHYNPHRDVVQQGVETMIRVALEALAKLD